MALQTSGPAPSPTYRFLDFGRREAEESETDYRLRRIVELLLSVASLSDEKKSLQRLQGGGWRLINSPKNPQDVESEKAKNDAEALEEFLGSVASCTENISQELSSDNKKMLEPLFKNCIQGLTAYLNRTTEPHLKLALERTITKLTAVNAHLTLISQMLSASELGSSTRAFDQSLREEGQSMPNYYPSVAVGSIRDVNSDVFGDLALSSSMRPSSALADVDD